MVLRHIVIKFGCDAFHLGQSAARHGRKVMVFVVIAHIERDEIQWSIVRVGLEAFGKHVVLGNEVSGHGMQSHRKQCANDEVPQNSPAEEIHDNRVEYQLND